MIKVLSEAENHQGYSEEYSVRFWFKRPDGIVEQRRISYYVKNSRQAHRVVGERWKKDFKGGKLISITYQ